MHHISSSEFKSQLGEYLAMTRDGPIMVEKAGRPVAVVLSPVEFEHLQRLEDLYWIARAQAAAPAQGCSTAARNRLIFGLRI